VSCRSLNILRKQFLIWRTLPQEQSERYLKEELVGGMNLGYPVILPPVHHSERVAQPQELID